MTVRIAVVDPLPMFRRGVTGTLEASGHTVEAPADPVAWVRQGTSRLVLLTVRSEQDWALLDRLRAATPVAPVIVVLDNDSAAVGARALRAGARSVLPRSVTEVALRRTVEAAMDGQVVLPAGVVAALTGPHPGQDERPDDSPTVDQLSWLRQLANGATVAQLADRAGYSERAMFRLLRSLYRQMGVRTRLQAIMRAQETGWL